MESDFKDHPKTVGRHDYWAQVKRTVDGRPVTDDQIRLIVDTIADRLELAADDCLLDLGCGNGALSAQLFDRIAGYLGIDFSDYLIGIANADFARPPAFRFAVDDIAGYLGREGEPGRFTKVLCYGCFSYLPEEAARRSLDTLAARFPNVRRVFIGNLPDRELQARFYRDPVDPAVLADPESKIGIWRSRAEFAGLAAATGWRAEFSAMPEGFYAAHYRYDATLTRPER